MMRPDPRADTHAAARRLWKKHHSNTPPQIRVIEKAQGGGIQMGVVLYEDGDRARVLKWKANTRRWTGALWAMKSCIKPVDGPGAPRPELKKDRRYRDALATISYPHENLE